MTDKQMVVKDNSLIGASYSLGVAEQRIIFLAIVAAREQDTLINASGVLRISALSYANQFNVEKHTAYKVLREGAVGLYGAEFKYTYPDKKTGKPFQALSRFVQKVAYADELGCIELIFSSDIIPLITRLSERYTEYDIKQISGLQSEYALRLYELLIQWRRVGKVPTMDLQDLREKLGVKENQYLEMCDFKKRVLNVALKQINEQTDITADYDQVKSGRKVTGMAFTFKQKKTAELLTAGTPTNTDADLFHNMTDAQIRTFSSKLASLPELGSNAPIGASTADYAAMIADHLADPIKQKQYHKHLSKLGFAKVKAKK